MRLLLTALILIEATLAQQTVAPTPDPVGPTRGTDWNGYNVVDSFETGYRFRTLGGSVDQYRSVVNYGNGVRLLSSFLSLNSRDGHGKYFDELVLTTQGLGNDPYESAILRIQKNRLYRYDMQWRLNDYHNPGLRTGGAQGQHLLDTEYTTQDHDFTLFPDSSFKFFLGYTRGNQTGPALSTIQLFDSRGNEFPLFENVRRVRNEYRVGNEVRLFGVRLTWMHGWDDFKEDSGYSSGANAGNNPASLTTIASFQRNEPYHGTSPYWRVGLFTDRKHFSANGRFTYVSGQRAFVLDENSVGTSRFGLGMTRQVVTTGNAQRPSLRRESDAEHFSDIAADHRQSDHHQQHPHQRQRRLSPSSTTPRRPPTSRRSSFSESALSQMRRTLNFQASRWLGFYGGYHYSDRLIRSNGISALRRATSSTHFRGKPTCCIRACWGSG